MLFFDCFYDIEHSEVNNIQNNDVPKEDRITILIFVNKNRFFQEELLKNHQVSPRIHDSQNIILKTERIVGVTGSQPDN
jgi:hypothetical protein